MKLKNSILSFTVLLTFLLFSKNGFSQSDKLTPDQEARIKFSIHLITYDTISSFENVLGESYYKLLVYSFSDNLSIPEIERNQFTANDKKIIENAIFKLNEVKKNPPTWNELLIKEAEYLKWIDISQRKKSKYKI